MAGRKGKGKSKGKSRVSPSLVIIGIISGLFAALGVMCIPCIMAAYPSIGLFFALMGALVMLLAPYNWFFVIAGMFFLLLGILLQFSARKKKYG